MYVLFSYWNGKNSSKSKIFFNVIATGTDEEEIITIADEALDEKLSLLDEDDREITEVMLMDFSDLFVAPAEGAEVIYHKSAGSTGVNEWHFVILEVDHNENGEIPPLTIASLQEALKDDSGDIDELRAVTISEILDQLAQIDERGLAVYLNELRERISKERDQ